MTINNNPVRTESPPIIRAIVECEDLTSPTTNIQNVDNRVAESGAYANLQDMQQGEIGTIQEGYIIGNIVQRSQEVFHTSVPTSIKGSKGEGRRALEALIKGKKTKTTLPQSEKPTPQPEHLCPFPSSIRIDLWQFGVFAEKERQADKNYLKDFSDDERHFLKQQIGQVGQHFNSFKDYQDAEKLREPFDKRLLANDPPPPSQQRVAYLEEEIKILNEEVTSLKKELDLLQKKLHRVQGQQDGSKKKARANIVQGKIAKLEKVFVQQNTQLQAKEELLLKKQDLLSQMESNRGKAWSPLDQLEKDNAKKSGLYGIPNTEKEQTIVQLKMIGALRKDLYEIKRYMGQENEETIAEKITQAAMKLSELAKALENASVMDQINKILQLSQSQKALESLEELLSQMYQQYFLQGREAPRLYKNQKNKDAILVAFKNRFGEKRFAEVSKQLQSFLQEIAFAKQPLEIVKQEQIIEDLNGVDLSERKVSELPFYQGTLLDKSDEEIKISKASHTLVVDTYLKNRLPLTIINLLQIDSSPEFIKLFPNKKMGATQVRFFFGTLNQAAAHYCPTSITKISGGGSEFYLFETYENRKVQVGGPQEKREECWRSYNYYLLIFDVPSIESLEHQLYQLRYAGIRVQNMIVKGDLEAFTQQQVAALVSNAETYLNNDDRKYGLAMRVFLLGNTRLILTAIGQHLNPGLDRDAAFEALRVQYITPNNPLFSLNYARVSLSNPGRDRGKPIRVALLALRMPNGTLAGKVTYALLTKARVEYITTVGAGGSINYKTPIGGYEFISQSYTSDQQGEPIAVDLMNAYKQKRVLIPPKTVENANIKVSGPLFETSNWLNNVKGTILSNVDVESWHIINAYNQAINFLIDSKDATPCITPALFISDHVGREDASLSKVIGKAAYKNNHRLVQFVAQQIRELFSPYSPPAFLPFLYKTYPTIFIANTLYTPPGMIDALPVSIPIANVSTIPFTEKNLGKIFQLINTATINRPYDSEELDIERPYFSETTRLTAYRPNHNGTHSARQARLLEATCELIKNHGSVDLQRILVNLPLEDTLALKLAAYCLRIGRCDESGWTLDGDDYNRRSAEIFIEYAKQLKIDSGVTNWLASRIRYSTFDDKGAEITDDYDRLAHAVLSLVHELDLVRIFPADKFKNKVNKHLQTLLPQTADLEQYANALIKFSQDLSIATGGTLGNARAPLQQEAEFTICSTYGDYCWKVVKKIALPPSLEPKNASGWKKDIPVSSSALRLGKPRKQKAAVTTTPPPLTKFLPQKSRKQQKNNL